MKGAIAMERLSTRGLVTVTVAGCFIANCLAILIRTL